MASDRTAQPEGPCWRWRCAPREARAASPLPAIGAPVARRGARRGAQGAFTLVEAVVALAILLVGILGVVAAIVSSVQAGRVAREHTLALGAAQENMELLQGASEAELFSLDGLTFAVPGLTPRADGTPIGEIAIDAIDAPLYRVEVRVRWRGPYGDETIAITSAVLPPQ